MKLEQRWQAMLYLRLSDQQFYCLLRRVLYQKFDGRWRNQYQSTEKHNEMLYMCANSLDMQY